jgi:hypothetical protein
MKKIDTPVLIVGGGGCGLSASIFLSNLSVDHLLVERHSTTSHLPKAHDLNQRTMKVFGQHGVAEAIYQMGCPIENFGQVLWLMSLGGDGELDRKTIFEMDASLPDSRSLHLPTRWTSAPAWPSLWNNTLGHSPPTAARPGSARTTLTVEELGRPANHPRPHPTDQPETVFVPHEIVYSTGSADSGLVAGVSSLLKQAFNEEQSKLLECCSTNLHRLHVLRGRVPLFGAVHIWELENNHPPGRRPFPFRDLGRR